MTTPTHSSFSQTPEADRRKEPGLTLLALLTGGATPVLLLVLSTGWALLVQKAMGMPNVLQASHAFGRVYLWAVLVPSLIALGAIALHSRRRYPRLWNRLWTGLAAGAIATFFLDFFRMLGVIQGWLPTDTPPFFGKLILGPQAPLGAALSVGTFYHFLNGASFGLSYTLLFGRPRWTWGIAWALFFELGMMTLPPMGVLFGPFGVKTGSPALFWITLVAHVAFGLVLGVLVERWVREPGTLFDLLRRTTAEQGRPRRQFS